jgi:glycosyltransferase involved in cell wall biosynthesis
MIYRKRIWFLISAQNLVPHGGVGTFFSGFASLCKKHNIKLDVIVDEEPRDVAEEMLANHQEVSIYFPENKIQSDHSKWCAFSSERTDLSRVMHFQLAMQKVFQLNLPDIIVSNTPESNFACQAMGLPTLFPTVFYTHLDHSVHWEMDHGLVPFHESLTDWLQKSLLYKHVIAGTQTQKNQISLQNRNVNALELPLACEPELWNSKYQNHPNPEGVLFIGRFEPRKNPQAFVRLIQATNLPAKVLTNRTGYRKWIEAFAEANITDYQVKHSLTGAPKLEFISSAKVAYLPSKLESFGYAALEALHFMPTVLLTKKMRPKQYCSCIIEQKNIIHKCLTITKIVRTVGSNSLALQKAPKAQMVKLKFTKLLKPIKWSTTRTFF